MSDILRKFIYFDPDANSNKYYQVQATPLSNGSYNVVYSWGRVKADGSYAQSQKERHTLSQIEAKVAEKLRKGYVEIELARQGGTNTFGDPTLDTTVNFILAAARLGIASYLGTSIDQISVSQIERAQGYLDAARTAGLAQKRECITEYYRTIPTQLPARIDLDSLVSGFDIDEQAQRLAQIKSAILTNQASSSGLHTTTEVLGAELSMTPRTDPIWDWAKSEFKRRSNNDPYNWHADVREIVSVKIPSERKRFKTDNVSRMFHGTDNENVAHILRDGLMVERCGYGTFGRGLYFADYYGKSADYTTKSRLVPSMMLVCDVSLGKQYVANSSHEPLPPAGYDSVWGKMNHTRLGGRSLHQNEFIVYSNDRVTITHIIICTLYT